MGAFNLLYTYMVGSIEIVEFYETQISVCSACIAAQLNECRYARTRIYTGCQ